ncbi:PLP-dependent transferase, partial [candidate division KSB1 bacterium]|nr:PLP-dependent transferase [candidate division KSB1 bacterium]
MHDATRLIHAGLPRPSQGEPFHPGPTFAAPFHLSGDPASAAYTYGRYHNPTWTAYESALTEMERGAATVVFSSGMAAVAATLGVTLKAGEAVVMPSDAYYTSRVLAQNFFATLGVEVRLAPTANNAQREHLRGAKLLWLETPSNPGLEVCDIALLAEAAHNAGALVVVDNTTPTCLGQQPLTLSADFSLSSDTKATTGHSDLILGHVSVREATWAEKLRTWRTQIGAVPGPMDCFLTLRGIKTLGVRIERHSSNATAVARMLEDHPAVRQVIYPGLDSHPQYALAQRQMRLPGGMLSVVLDTVEQAHRLVTRTKLFALAESLGGVESLIEHPYSMTHASTAD